MVRCFTTKGYSWEQTRCLIVVVNLESSQSIFDFEQNISSSNIHNDDTEAEKAEDLSGLSGDHFQQG